MYNFNSIKKPTHFYLSDGKIVIDYMYGWPKQPHSNITKITYIFPDYDKKTDYLNQKNPVTEEDRIQSIKCISQIYKLTYIKNKKEKDLLKHKNNIYLKNKTSQLEKEIENIENSINIYKNSIHPYFYNTQTTIYPHQQKVISDILRDIASITRIEFIASDPKYDADLKFGFYNDFYSRHGSKEFSYTTRGFAVSPSRYGTPIKEVKLDEQYQYTGSIFLNLSKHKYHKIIHQRDLNNYIEKEGDIGDAFHFQDNGTVLIIKRTNTLIEKLKNDKYQLGTYEYKVILHETGHALGLQHAWQYLEYKDKNHVLASLKYSVMGYLQPKSEDADFGGLYPMTFMPLDILLLQYLYGENMTTRLENNIYGFNSNTGRAAYSLNSIEDKLVSCIWDSGGIDTLDFSLYTVNQFIDLNEGSFSDIGGLRSNISIAYKTIIENAIGGKGHDTIKGNKANNDLRGGDGNDILYGGLGNDYLYGGKGNDILYGDDGDDTLIDFYGANLLDGGKGNDRIFVASMDRGLSGKNIILAGEGDDEIYLGTGTHHITGGPGNDTFNFFCYEGVETNGSIFDFEKGKDKITLITRDYRKIDLSKMKKVDKLSGDKNEFSFNHDKQANKTIIEISTSYDNNKSHIHIETIGMFSYDDLFAI